MFTHNVKCPRCRRKVNRVHLTAHVLFAHPWSTNRAMWTVPSVDDTGYPGVLSVIFRALETMKGGNTRRSLERIKRGQAGPNPFASRVDRFVN